MSSSEEAKVQTPSPLFQIAGEVAWLMTKSFNHQHLFINELEWLIFPPLTLNQYHIFRAANGHIIGVALWASVSDAVDERFGKMLPRLSPHEWQNGPHLWLIDLISPFGRQEEMLDHLRNKIFANKTIKVQKQNDKGEIFVDRL